MLPSPAVQAQGAGVVSADNINTFLQAALNVAQLRTIAGLDNMTVWMLGTTNPNDGGQGPFFWDADATTADDNGVTSIQPAGVVGAGRWIRQPIAGGGSIPLSQLANIPPDTLLGNALSGVGPVTALTVSQILSMLGLSGFAIPTGTVITYAAQGAPTGWLVCDGSAVSRTAYPNLNALAASASYLAPWGAGDGVSTFNVPNLLGRFVRSWDSSGVVDPGRTFGGLQGSSMVAHQHITDTPTLFESSGYVGPFGNTTVTINKPGFVVAGVNPITYGLSNDGTSYSGFNPNPGGQIGNETRPTNIALGMIIKT